LEARKMFKRLTEKTIGTFEYDLKDHKHEVGEFGTYEAFYNYSIAIKQLGKYEDTGLTPEEVQEIAKAKGENRLVELPCKVGDKVWLILETLNDKFEIVESVVTKVFHTSKDSFISCWIDCQGIGNSLEFQISEFGENVFLVKEESENALKKRGDTP
jgi:hypothetical protein